MTDLAGGFVLLVRKPDPEPWAAPGLTPLARAHATGCALGLLGQDITPLIEAMARTRRDAIEDAALLAEAMAFDAVAARIRRLKENDR